jgi:hypothetical protein
MLQEILLATVSELAVNCIFFHRTLETNIDAREDGWHTAYLNVSNLKPSLSSFSLMVSRGGDCHQGLS